jgi:magnesium-transporting ATPase (P-type)
MNLKTIDVVPGDMILLTAGSVVPADLRLIEAQEMTVDETNLTGESEPVAKVFVSLFPPCFCHPKLMQLYLKQYQAPDFIRCTSWRSQEHGLHVDRCHQGKGKRNGRCHWHANRDW